VASWAEFEAAAPELAHEGKRLLYQFGVGLGFLATVREDGGPRLHPVCPVIAADELYVFVVPSPKRGDLRRDGRYALHSYPPEEVDDEFYATGRATEVQDPDIRAEVADAYHDQVAEGWSLFALDIERCLHAKYRHRGDWPPTYTKWTDPNVSALREGNSRGIGT
jgi:hypothetical protein